MTNRSLKVQNYLSNVYTETLSYRHYGLYCCKGAFCIIQTGNIGTKKRNKTKMMISQPIM